MAEIEIKLSSIELNVDETATIYTFDSPRTYLFQSTPELISAGVSVQTYGVITVPTDATLTGQEVVEVEYVNKVYSALLSDIISASEGDDISFTSLFITVEDLADVEITDIADGQALVYDATSEKWVNGNVAGGGESLEDLTDVDITSVSNGDTLVWDSTSEKWVNGSAGGGDDILWVEVTYTYDAQTYAQTWTMNKNYSQLKAAYDANKLIICKWVESFTDNDGGEPPVEFTVYSRYITPVLLLGDRTDNESYHAFVATTAGSSIDFNALDTTTNLVATAY